MKEHDRSDSPAVNSTGPGRPASETRAAIGRAGRRFARLVYKPAALVMLTLKRSRRRW